MRDQRLAVLVGAVGLMVIAMAAGGVPDAHKPLQRGLVVGCWAALLVIWLMVVVRVHGLGLIDRSDVSKARSLALMFVTSVSLLLVVRHAGHGVALLSSLGTWAVYYRLLLSGIGAWPKSGKPSHE